MPSPPVPVIQILRILRVRTQLNSSVYQSYFCGSGSSHIEAAQFAASIPAPVRQLPHGDMQRHHLNIASRRIRLGSRINHPFLDRLDVVAGTVKAALDFGGGAALDFYRPMLTAGPGQQKINCCTGVATVEIGGVASVDETTCRLQINPRAARKTKPVCKPQCVCNSVVNSKTRCPDNSRPLGQHSAPASTKQR